MIISPEIFAEMQREKKYKELLEVRDELLRSVKSFEEDLFKGNIELFHVIEPDPELVYQFNMEYLGKVCELISEKYNEEFIWGEGED